MVVGGGDWGFIYFVANTHTEFDPKRMEGGRRHSENVSALSAGAYTTTWLMVTWLHRSTCCCVQARFLGMEKNTLFFVMIYSALFNNVYKALNLFLNKYVA
jgi:hypothetical protein